MHNELIYRQDEFKKFLSNIQPYAIYNQEMLNMFWSALMADGFAHLITKGNITGLQLTEEGRKLQKCGTYENYILELYNEDQIRMTVIHDEEEKQKKIMFITEQQYHLAIKQTAYNKRQTLINWCIAIATSIAALYYILEIANHCFGIYRH